MQRVGRVGRRLDRIAVDAVLERLAVPALRHAGAGDGVQPRVRPAMLVEPCLQVVDVVGPVVIVLDVLLASPQHLDRRVDVTRDARADDDAVDLEAPAEAAADQLVVQP